MTEAPKLAISSKGAKAQLIPSNRVKSDSKSNLNQTAPISGNNYPQNVLEMSSKQQMSNVRTSLTMI